jgi:UDP-GlcNAc:undecaprenyl-phosphate GlcNAc-1-phosphate transferase
MSTLTLAVLAFAVALLAGAVLTPVVRGAALSAGMVRGAQADRWHRRPTPAIGGLAIWLAFLIGSAAVWVVSPDAFALGLDFVPDRAWLDWPASEGILIAASLAFAIGLVDDLRPLSPLSKLAGQFVAASILLLSGIGVWLSGIYAIDVVVSLLWFVGVANAVNLLDNMDGVAAGVAAIASAYLAILFLVEGQVGFVLIAVTFVGALVGFLAHNYPPARIFMGDSGSLFLGIFLAGLALAPAEGASRSLTAALVAPVLLLAIPILDTTLVTVTRLLEGRSIAQGGTDHTSHRLVAMGVSEERAMWLLWAIAAAGGAIGVLLRTAARDTAIILGGAMSVFLVVLGGFLLAVRFRGFTAEEREKIPLYRVVLALHERLPFGVLALDGVVVLLVYYGAYVVRWDASQLPAELPYFRDSVVLVVAIKLFVLTVMGAYAPRWRGFSMSEATRLLQASLLASAAVVTALFITQRTGVSRGVMIIDATLAPVALVGMRLSFRWFEGTTRTLAHSGTPTVVFGTPEDTELVLRVLEALGSGPGGDREMSPRPVALASPGYPRLRGRSRGLPLFGTPNALSNALQESRATALILAGSETDPVPREVRDYLTDHGGVDVFRIGVSVRRFEGAAAPRLVADLGGVPEPAPRDAGVGDGVDGSDGPGAEAGRASR